MSGLKTGEPTAPAEVVVNPKASHRPDMVRHFDRSRQYVDYKDATVLEIGSDRWGVFAENALTHGAGKIFATNITPGWPEYNEVSPRHVRQKLDANAISGTFPNNTFDVVYGIAVLEHIPCYWLMLDELAKVLKPGGIAYLHGGPIWNAPAGHHVYTTIKDVEYKFSDRPCIIQNWEHLFGDGDHLIENMMSRGAEREIAEGLSDFVYNTTQNNRYTFSRHCRIFEDSPLEIVARLDNTFGNPKPEILEKLRRGPWGDETAFHVRGMTFVVRKPLE